MKTINNWRLPVACLLVALLGMSCSREQAAPQQGAVSVTVVTVEPKTIPADFSSVAQTEGSLEVEVRAQVSGIMQNFFFAEGGRVTQGQRLFQIDPRPFQIALEQGQASLASAEAVLVQARARFARIKPLYEENAVSKQDFDDAQAAVSTAEASVMMSKASVNSARLNLAYSRVESPISGIVGKSEPSRGSLITAQQTLLTKITRTDPMYVSFGLSDRVYMNMVREVAEGTITPPADGRLVVRLTLADKTVYPMTGSVNFQDIRISGQTSTIQTRAEMPNPSGMLRPGQYVTATLSGMVRPNAMIVPQKAVMKGDMGRFVFVVDKQNKAQIRPIEPGEWFGDQWIVKKGLNAGDRVVTEGMVRLRPGAPVTIVSGNQAATGSKPAPATPASAGQAEAKADGTQAQPGQAPSGTTQSDQKPAAAQ